MHPALFLDRDGVIIENRPDYIRSWTDVEIFPQALAALARFREIPYKIIIVTNQSVVGRGLIPLSQAQEINAGLLAEIRRSGGRIDGLFMCPHAPQDNCYCRKPRPGLFHQAAASLSVVLSRSMMIGDAWSDLLAAQAAGIRRLILLRTGRGAAQAALPPPPELPHYQIFDALSDALTEILDNPTNDL